MHNVLLALIVSGIAFQRLAVQIKKKELKLDILAVLSLVLVPAVVGESE